MIHYHALKKTGHPTIKNHTYGSFIEAKNNGEFAEYDIMKDPYMRKYTYKSLNQLFASKKKKHYVTLFAVQNTAGIHSKL